MKIVKQIALFCLFMFHILNSVYSQNLNLVKYNTDPPGGYTMSSVIEAVTDGETSIAIGPTVPSAKLHVRSRASGVIPVFKSDLVASQGSTVLGSVENWRMETFSTENVYYGIYQSQPTSGLLIKNYINNNLGIGVVNPANKLDVDGIIGCTGAAATGIRIDNLGQPFGFQYHIRASGLPDDGGEDGGSEPIEGDSVTYYPLTLYSYGAKVQNSFECTGVTKTNGIIIKSFASPGSVLWCGNTDGTSVWTDPSVFKIYNGKVSIGIDTTYDDYKLAVNGKVICEEMKIKLQGNWPDFVFDKKYQLPTLKEVDNFIQANNHLPDMPTAKEVKENGVNVGEMNALMLKKIEELTLYIIALQKEVDLLKTKTGSR